MPKPNGYVLNYVILTTHSSHLYSMWDFTHTFASLWASRSLCEPWTSPTHSSLPNGIFTSSARHPWVSCTPSMRITCQPRMHIHGNLAPHHYLALLAIFLCWAFFFFSPSLGSLCVGRLGFLCPCWVGTMNTSPLSPYTTNLALIPLVGGINTLGSFLE